MRENAPHEVLDLITPTNNDDVIGAQTPAPSSAASQEVCSQDTRVSESDKEPISFFELKALLTRLQVNQELYRQYERKVFVVPCKMKGNHQYFNIHKNKHWDKKHKKEDKVRRVIHAAL